MAALSLQAAYRFYLNQGKGYHVCTNYRCIVFERTFFGKLLVSTAAKGDYKRISHWSRRSGTFEFYRASRSVLRRSAPQNKKIGFINTEDPDGAAAALSEAEEPYEHTACEASLPTGGKLRNKKLKKLVEAKLEPGEEIRLVLANIGTLEKWAACCVYSILLVCSVVLALPWLLVGGLITMLFLIIFAPAIGPLLLKSRTSPVFFYLVMAVYWIFLLPPSHLISIWGMKLSDLFKSTGEVGVVTNKRMLTYVLAPYLKPGLVCLHSEISVTGLVAGNDSGDVEIGHGGFTSDTKAWRQGSTVLKGVPHAREFVRYINSLPPQAPAKKKTKLQHGKANGATAAPKSLKKVVPTVNRGNSQPRNTPTP